MLLVLSILFVPCSTHETGSHQFFVYVDLADRLCVTAITPEFYGPDNITDMQCSVIQYPVHFVNIDSTLCVSNNVTLLIF